MSKKFIPLVAVDQIPAEGLCKVKLAGVEPIAVFGVEGRYYAIQDTCSHALASLADGWLDGYEVYCPVHEARFDIRDGNPLCFPATKPLRTFPTSLQDGMVCADIGTAFPESQGLK
jgi:nitrite reductase/ring-hydroxylating ferredoxin subunit